MCSAPLFSAGGLLGSPCVSVKADRHVLCDLKERLEQPSFERCVFISVLTCLTFCLRELGEASDNCYFAVFVFPSRSGLGAGGKLSLLSSIACFKP